ncbi:MAG: formylglycine-generating enzyme family protein [Planctomycetota bacterium]|jgi:serine/threonine-protein kinase
MGTLKDSSGTTAVSLGSDRVKDTIKRIHEYVWARHIDGSDHYDHSISDAEALALLDEHYAAIANRSSPDQVYLGILLFERAFEEADKQAEWFERARKIFEFYRRVTGEDDWPAVEDRLDDIREFFADSEAPAPAVESIADIAEEPPQPDQIPELEAVAEEVAEPAPATEAAPEGEVAPAEEVAEPVAAEAAEVVQAEAAETEPEAEVKAEPEAVAQPAQPESAAETRDRQVAEAAAARREATEAFIADLDVVDGMQLVPAGTFIFGSGGQEVFLDSFYVDKLPITNDEYMRFVRETGYRIPRYATDSRYNKPRQPVVGVGFSDAQQFAKWAGKELPTELQWEKAARGTDGRPYPWGNDPPGSSDACFGLDPAEGEPQPVGSSLRNVSPFGVHDVCGNIWEWTKSTFAKNSEFRVVRGGSYNDPPEMLALDFRLEAHPKDKCEAVGFRCVKNIHE